MSEKGRNVLVTILKIVSGFFVVQLVCKFIDRLVAKH